MTTLWNKLVEYPVLYQLDEQSTIQLHPALHDSISSRLLCYLEDDSGYYLNTICLSDFIRSGKETTDSLFGTNFFRCLVSSAKRPHSPNPSTGETLFGTILFQ